MLFFLIIWAAFCDKIAKNRLFGVPLSLHSSAVLRNTLAADGGGLNTGECFTKLAVDFCTWMYGNRRGCPYNPCRGKALNSHLFFLAGSRSTKSAASAVHGTAAIMPILPEIPCITSMTIRGILINCVKLMP